MSHDINTCHVIYLYMSCDTVLYTSVSCSSLFTPPQASKSIKKRQTPHSFSEEQKISSTSSSDKMRRSSTPRSSDKQPVKRKGTRTNSLVVSIKKDLLSTSSLPQRRSKRRLSSSS